MSHRLAYLCGEYPRATDTFIQREVAALRHAGMHVEMISVRRPQDRERGSSEQDAERAATHYLLPVSAWRLLAAHATLMARSPRRYAAAINTAWTVRAPGLRALTYQLFYFAEAGLVAMRMVRHELVHLHNHAPDASGYVTMLAAELSGRTYSMTIHGFGILAEPTKWRLTEKLERSLFTVCVSHHARGQAMLWSRADCWDRYHLIHCGVDPKDYPVARRHEGQGRRLLFVGRLDAVKGLPVLMEAFARLAREDVNVQLDLAGDGPARAGIEAQVAKLGLSDQVSFHGYCPQSHVRELMLQSDVLVMTSFFEGIPVVLMEAMASGLPVVAPRITGIPELVEDGVHGLLTESGDVASLESAIRRLMGDGDLRQRFGTAGRARVAADFNLDTEVRRLARLFGDRLAGNAAATRPAADAPVGECGHD